MSALTTHTSNQFRERRKKKEKKRKTQTSDQKAIQKSKRRSLEREKSRSPKARETARHNRDKMLQNCGLLRVRQKGSTPSAKEHNLKSGKKELPIV
jgi:hypothetical protein